MDSEIKNEAHFPACLSLEISNDVQTLDEGEEGAGTDHWFKVVESHLSISKDFIIDMVISYRTLVHPECEVQM